MRLFLSCLLLSLLLPAAVVSPAAAKNPDHQSLRLAYIGAINGYLQLCG